MSIALLFPPGFKPVIKHGEHDQSSHGNWATGEGDFEDKGSGGGGDYDAAYDTYSERYGVDKDGIPVGMDFEEVDAIESYTASGYVGINSMLRAGDSLYEITQEERIEHVKFFQSQEQRALKEWAKENNKSEDYLLTESEQAEAFDNYARRNADSLNSYLLEIKEFPLQPDEFDRTVSALDSAISQAPVLFGDKNLYRVYSDNVLSTMKEGDIIRDKGYLSTTRSNLTKDSYARDGVGSIKETPDTVAVILPNESKNGKGFSVDIWGTVTDKTSAVRDREKEVLLPRGTPLKFLGYKTDVGNEARVAVFQRMDK